MIPKVRSVQRWDQLCLQPVPEQNTFSCERRWDTGLFTYSLSVVAFPRQHWSRIVVINCSVFKAKNILKNLTFCRKNVSDIWLREIFVL